MCTGVNDSLGRLSMTLRAFEPHFGILQSINTGQLTPVEQVTCNVDSVAVLLTQWVVDGVA